MSEKTLNDLLVRLNTLEGELARLKAAPGAARAEGVGDRCTSGASPSTGAEHAASRRDLLRAGAVTLGAAMAILPARSADAANGDPVLVGGSFTGTSPTTITNTSIGGNNNAAIHGVAGATSGDCFGLWGETNSVAAAGVVGNANATTGQNAGMYGESNSPDGAGIVGNANVESGGATGVLGMTSTAGGFGVSGENMSGAGTAIFGQLHGDATASGIAIYGLNNSNYAGPSPGAGGFGAYGFSAKGHGLVGATASPGAAALVGATNGVAGAYAAVFYGPVVVTGSFAVAGSKSAAVKSDDGSHRLVYCVESPESWLEDFGKAQLRCGRADVAIDPGFAAIANMDDYHVFVSAYDQHGELMVSERTPRGFRVSAKDDSSEAAFSWRLVARRKDIAADRLAPIEIPQAPRLPTVPGSAENSSRANRRGFTLRRE